MDKSEFFANARGDLNGPFHGVVVVEATTTWAGPMAACILADFGARVIKVEHPAGEVTRRLPPYLPDSDLTVAHETVNRNKENISLNLQKPEGRDILLKLCQKADIFIENFRPGTLARWGVGYDDLAAVKPDIVYVSISGFGQYGTLSDRVGYDPIAQNYCGWASLNGEPNGGPTKAPTFLGDDTAGLHGALAAMAALRHRDQTGEGQHVDVALIDGLMYQSNGYPTAGAVGLPMERWGNQFGIATPVNNYLCTDGNVFAGVLLDTHWQVLAKLVEREDMADLNAAQRIDNREEVDLILADWCATRTVAEVVDTFAELGLPATRVNTYADLAKEEHVASREMLQSTRLTDGTDVPLTAPPAKFSRTPTRIRTAAPTLGQENEKIYAELGYDESDLSRLRDDRVI
jgi:formyl-CoA transferase